MASTNLPPCRIRDIGLNPGILQPGRLNAITDIPDVMIGHYTMVEGDDIRTGATAILPHGENIFQEKVPAGVAVGNGYGKMMGYTQVAELGELETPILLTNTLAVPRAADALLDWTLSQPENAETGSVNCLIGETNDGFLNNIRKRALTPALISHALQNAHNGPVEEGAVGAGTGTICFGWKGGIGTSSRVLPSALGGFTVGALVQTNFGGVLQICGLPVGVQLHQHYLSDYTNTASADGSIMIVLATDAPLSDRNLTRLARRAFAGLARTGASMSDGSGDYAIAFSTNHAVRRTKKRRGQISAYPEAGNNAMSPLFQAAIEAVEEAIYNSLCMANTSHGYKGSVNALPLSTLKAMISR